MKDMRSLRIMFDDRKSDRSWQGRKEAIAKMKRALYEFIIKGIDTILHSGKDIESRRIYCRRF